MSGFIGALKSGVELMKRGDDDTYDRMSSRYSVAICLVFAFLISGGKYDMPGGYYNDAHWVVPVSLLHPLHSMIKKSFSRRPYF